ncbi:cupin [Streptomyces sp. NPDC049954]|uniref:cupin n=1 Tax=Streptomyces sp. NPDC049954 TaxID=3155779 RepID=UPI00344A9086
MPPKPQTPGSTPDAAPAPDAVPRTLDLLAEGVRLFEDGRVEVGERRMTDDPGAWQLATFAVRTDADVHADHWEMHPGAQEVVAVLSGGPVRFTLRAQPDPSDGSPLPAVTTVLTENRAVVVPRGRWHRLSLDAPATLMSVTLRRGTVVEKVRAEEGDGEATGARDA